AEPGFQSAGFVLHLTAQHSRQRRKGLGPDTTVFDPPKPGNEAVDEERGLDHPSAVDDRPAVLVRDHARPVGMRQDEVVVAREEPDRGARVAGRERGAWQIEQLTSPLVAEAPQRLERRERGLEVAHAEPAPLGDVSPRRRPESPEVATDEALSRWQR